MAAHPPGWLEYREAFSNPGDATARGSATSAPSRPEWTGTLFMHAGLNPTASPDDQAVDARSAVRAQIARIDRFYEPPRGRKARAPLLHLARDARSGRGGDSRGERGRGRRQGDRRPRRTSAASIIDFVREAAEMVRVGDWHVLSRAGPALVSRLCDGPGGSAREPLRALLSRHKATRIVVGHTPVQAATHPIARRRHRRCSSTPACWPAPTRAAPRHSRSSATS